MLIQNFGVTNEEHYGMLWYFWSGQLVFRLLLRQPRSQVLTSTRRETLSLSLSLAPSGRVEENPGNEVVSTRTNLGKK